MTVFFFVVGLEIRREIHSGELSEVRRAALPLAAALGGMLVPALVFFFLNAGRPSAVGWAVPMATDIAFAVGALALLGKRVTPALRILLLALAVIDDVSAIIVIALFYSAEIAALGFAVLGLGILATFIMQLLGVRTLLAYVAPAMVIWAGAYLGGIHPTLAGVIVGFMTPVRAWYAGAFLDQTEASVRMLRSNGIPDDQALLPHLDNLSVANREAVSPVERLQPALHGWGAFGIMPLFAFANAGVPVGQISLPVAPTSPLQFLATGPAMVRLPNFGLCCVVFSTVYVHPTTPFLPVFGTYRHQTGHHLVHQLIVVLTKAGAAAASGFRSSPRHFAADSRSLRAVE